MSQKRGSAAQPKAKALSSSAGDASASEKAIATGWRLNQGLIIRLVLIVLLLVVLLLACPWPPQSQYRLVSFVSENRGPCQWSIDHVEADSRGYTISTFQFKDEDLDESTSEEESLESDPQPLLNAGCSFCKAEGMELPWPKNLSQIRSFDSTGQNSTVYEAKRQDADDVVVKIVCGDRIAEKEKTKYVLLQGQEGFVQAVDFVDFSCPHETRVGIVMEKAKGEGVHHSCGKTSGKSLLRMLLPSLTSHLLGLYHGGHFLAHADLKPDNLHWDNESRTLTILDAGSMITEEDVKLRCSPKLFTPTQPPETCGPSRPYRGSFSLIDSWHIGLLALAVLFGTQSIPKQESDAYSAEAVARAQNALKEKGFEVIAACLEQDPEKRITVEDLHEALTKEPN